MSKSKDIGTAAETAVVKVLRVHGFPYAERRALMIHDVLTVRAADLDATDPID